MREAKKACGSSASVREICSRCSTYSNSGPNVLGEKNALELNDEEVDKLLKVTSNALKSLARNCVVLPRAHLGGKTLAENKVTNKLSGSGNTEHSEDGLQDITLDGDEAEEKDAGDDGGEGNGGSARVLPAEERVEERVVVREVLISGSLGVGRLTGSSQVGELVLGGDSLSAGLVGDRAVGKVLHGLGVLDGVHGVGGGWLGC